MDDQVQLLRKIEAYCREAGLAETTFGRRAVNDGKFVSRLREGKGVTIRTFNRVQDFIDQNPVAKGGSMAVTTSSTKGTPTRKPAGKPKKILKVLSGFEFINSGLANLT